MFVSSIWHKTNCTLIIFIHANHSFFIFYIIFKVRHNIIHLPFLSPIPTPPLHTYTPWSLL